MYNISNFLIVQKKVNIYVSRERKEDREIKQMGQSVNNEWILINSIWKLFILFSYLLSLKTHSKKVTQNIGKQNFPISRCNPLHFTGIRKKSPASWNRQPKLSFLVVSHLFVFTYFGVRFLFCFVLSCFYFLHLYI